MECNELHSEIGPQSPMCVHMLTVLQGITVCQFSGRSEAKCYKKLWWAIEFQLSVAQNAYRLNAWVSLLTKVCNVRLDHFSHRYDLIKKKLQQSKEFYKTLVYRKCIEVDI